VIAASRHCVSIACPLPDRMDVDGRSSVTVLQGPRTVELKRALVNGITDAFVDTLGVPAASVQIWIQETPADSWGQGGVLTADK
jgi:4-oxalocrotonate tautomerase